MPPLRSLQVFEAAARCGGFTAAGEELGITQSGVSRQVADLEASLGAALFVRNGPRLTATPAGRRLAEALGEAFARIAAATGEARRADRATTLSMLPSVATRWFAPRLGRFMAAHPRIDLRIAASRHLVDFAAEGIDAALRYGRAPAPGVEAVRLASETVQPVCTPDFARRHALRRPRDLIGATLLHGDIPEDWAAWFAAAGLAEAPPAGPRLGDDGAILQAALDHQGVALGRSRLVADDLALGRLIAPFDVRLEASHAYWFVHPKGAAPSPAVQAIRDWLLEEFRAMG
ncbi:MAG: transcriptional regulator GcvA [Pseudomonadota bacterium]